MEITTRSVPPGFRFQPTEEELVGYYLLRKINCLKIDLDIIVDIDLYRMEPWDIQEKCNLGYEEQNEWYFFSHKDKKYPTGTRTNRATTAGFWKATGRDKAVFSKNKIIGMRKTLVFYKGRAPNGRKSDWIIHEYRLQTSQQHTPSQEEGWVVCRAFRKPTPSTNRPYGCDPCWHIMSSRSSATNTTHVISPSPLPDLVEFNYSHPAATTMTSFHRHKPLPDAAVITFHDCLHMGHTNCSLDCNYSPQGFESTTINQGDGGLFEDYKSGNSWKFINSLLASDDEHISSDQVPSCLVANDPSSQLDSNIINPGSDQLLTAEQDDQVAHFLA